MSLYDSFFSDLNKDHVYDLIKDIVFQNNGVNIFLNDEYRQIYDKGLEKIFDLVLIDAPCSGIGTWSRSPDSRLYFNKKKLAELINIQSELLSKGSTMVAPGGKLAYVTCSILPEEGVDQIEKFKLSANRDFSEIDMSNMWNDNLSLTNSFQYPFDSGKKSITINPAIHKMDGFFISMFQRKR